uniref:Hexosyltransferase n=1 Tax=Cyprinus carpio TaxID=7962 RepID=A0A8C1N0X9_CYPCA
MSLLLKFRKISQLRYRTILLHREGVTMSRLSNAAVQWEDQLMGAPPSYTRYRPTERGGVIEWDFLTSRHLYSTSERQMPRQGLGNLVHSALEDTVLQVMEMINENSKTRGRIIDFKEIQYGYRRVDPLHGAEYILDLLLLYKKHKGRKVTVSLKIFSSFQISEYTKEAQEQTDLSIIPMTGGFSRGLALEMGSSQLANNSLLFFCDVDLVFNADALQRCRENTIEGGQVYFPIVFSQYDPKIVYAGGPPEDSAFVFTKKSGFWRHYGFGITCIFKSDFLKAGGFDTSIQGWGLEDVDLFTKVINSGLKVFRSQEAVTLERMQ